MAVPDATTPHRKDTENQYHQNASLHISASIIQFGSIKGASQEFRDDENAAASGFVAKY